MTYKKSEIMKDILIVLGAVGLVGVAIVAPNAVGAIVSLFDGKKDYTHKQIKRSADVLEKNKLISVSYEGDKTVVKLTKNGKQKLLKYKLDDIKIKPQKIWDKKWRLVIFDIPKGLGKVRMEFTRKLKEVGFILLQKSVWVCPYPCEDEIDYLKEIFKVRPFIRIITADNIDIVGDLRKKFKLE